MSTLSSTVPVERDFIFVGLGSEHRYLGYRDRANSWRPMLVASKIRGLREPLAQLQ